MPKRKEEAFRHMVETSDEVTTSLVYDLTNEIHNMWLLFSPLQNVERGTAKYTGTEVHILGFRLSVYGELYFTGAGHVGAPDWQSIPVRLVVVRHKHGAVGNIYDLPARLLDDLFVTTNSGLQILPNAPIHADHFDEFDVLYDRTIYTSEKGLGTDNISVFTIDVQIDDEFHVEGNSSGSSFMWLKTTSGPPTTTEILANYSNGMPIAIVLFPQYRNRWNVQQGAGIGGYIWGSTSALLMNM